MDRAGEWTESAVVTTAYGVLLLAAAVVWHLFLEADSLQTLGGPLVAFVLDGGLAAGIVLIGYRLAHADYEEAERRLVALSGIGGSVAFALAITATIVVRLVEGRAVAETPFVVLTSLGAGFLAGAFAGVYRAEAAREARRIRQTRDALAFVNGMLRHDVRNDANVIAGYADAVEGDDETTLVLQERAETVIDRTDQARAVAETVTGQADPSAVELAPFVAETVASVDDTYRHATFTVDVPAGVAVRANDALRPALENLLENAVEHNDHDEPTVTVTASEAAPGESVTLRITDDGPGIPDAEKATLFDHDAPGTAKGLHVAETIVAGLDGTIRVEDAEPRGTSFVIELPRAPTPTASDTPDAADDPFRTQAE